MDVFDTYYYDQDHLGNIRQVTDKSGKAVQTTDYYPFGMQLCDGTANNFDQNHKYNGQGSCQRVQTSSLSMPSAAEAQPKVKEFDTMHGLNTYDYGARQYNPVTARWDRMDPLCEKYYSVSPYAYCMNNPIKFVDPDGNEVGLPEEIQFALSHPIAASRIGAGVTHNAMDISTNATRFATRGLILYGSQPTQQVEQGSENGAFRHTLWQAQITSEFGADIAKQAGDAHEDNPNIDMEQTNFKNLNDADKSVDLHNNIIGRKIGKLVQGKGMQQTAMAVLNVFANNGLFVAKKTKNGYTVTRQQLDPNKYKKLLKIFKTLDNNGMNEDDYKRISDEIRKQLAGFRVNRI